MTHTYSISGMTCNGCVAKVTHLLSSVKGVSSVEVSLDKQNAIISSSEHINTSDFESALKGTKYSITAQPTEEKSSSLKTYLPVFLIFAYITAVTLGVQAVSGSFNLIHWMNNFMAGFFLVFSFFKLLDVPAFASGYAGYDIIAKRWNGYGYLYPFIELGLGLAFLIPVCEKWANIATLIVMVISIIGVLQSVLNKRKIQCACLGAVFNLPMSTVTIIEDAVMIIMSAASLLLMAH